MKKRSTLQSGEYSPEVSAPEAYRRQIAECAQALAVARGEAVSGYLAAGNTAEMVKMFTDGNLDKRFLKLKDQLELLADAFEDFDDLVAEYVKSRPLNAYDTRSSDANHFTEWLEQSRRLSAEQHDLITCQRSRHEVEERASQQRLQHIRFQEFAASRERFLGEWGPDPELRIELNPVRVWATFHTPVLLDEDDHLPAIVVFFPVEDNIHTAVVEVHAQALLRELETRGPSRLDDLAVDCLPEIREEIATICGDFVELGLAALV